MEAMRPPLGLRIRESLMVAYLRSHADEAAPSIA
jgi:hypothetical protein